MFYNGFLDGTGSYNGVISIVSEGDSPFSFKDQFPFVLSKDKETIIQFTNVNKGP